MGKRSRSRTDSPVLASGHKLVWKDGRPVYSPAQLALCCSLVELPEHPLQLREKNMMSRTIEALDLVPDAALIALADLINELRLDGRLRHRPLLSEMRRMALTAIDSCRELQGELALYGLWRQTREQKQKPAAEAGERIILRRPGSAETASPKIILRRPGAAATENIIDQSHLLGSRCAVRLDGDWHLGKVVRIRSDTDIKVELDNGRLVAGDPHDPDFRRLD
jgi:hypothetical protein